MNTVICKVHVFKEGPKNIRNLHRPFDCYYTATYCQIDGEDFFNFCGLLRKRELYQNILDLVEF